MLTTVGLLLPGCGLADEPAAVGVSCSPSAVVAASTPLVAATAGSTEPEPGLSGPSLSAVADLGQHGVTCLDVLGPDGALVGYPLAPRRPDGATEQGPQRETVLTANLTRIGTAVAELTSRTPEIDPLRLLSTAAAQHPAPTTLYLITTGLSALPQLDLNRLDWDGGGRQVGAWLVAQGYLPVLTGWRVHLVGLGESAGRQPDLSDPARLRLRLLWLDICAATKATCVAEHGPTPSRPPRSTNPVTLVVPPWPPTPPVALRLPAPQLFALDSAQLAGTADAQLRAVVEEVLRAGVRISVTGHTDGVTGTPEHNLELSRSRALAVRDRLLALGMPADRIVTVEGVGARDAAVPAERSDPRQIDLDRNVEIRFVQEA